MRKPQKLTNPVDVLYFPTPNTGGFSSFTCSTVVENDLSVVAKEILGNNGALFEANFADRTCGPGAVRRTNCEGSKNLLQRREKKRSMIYYSKYEGPTSAAANI